VSKKIDLLHRAAQDICMHGTSSDRNRMRGAAVGWAAFGARNPPWSLSTRERCVAGLLEVIQNLDMLDELKKQVAKIQEV